MKTIITHKTGVAILLLALTACIETRPPPEPSHQVKVPYGPKIYLRDQTLGDSADRCTLLGEVKVVNTATVVCLPGQAACPTQDPTKAHNCYVEVVSGDLDVDVLEVTNELYQHCVDSTVCKKPDPSDVDKIPVCDSESSFDTCPVVAVPQVEAKRFCEFVGKRVPSMVEHVIMRQQNQPQSPTDVQVYPNGNDDPKACDKAVLQNICSNKKPQPMKVAGKDSEGGGKADRTSQGVYDLTGNAAEWAADLLPSVLPRTQEDLPWFCLAPLPVDSVDGMGLPVCPAGQVCIKGRYQVGTGTAAVTREDFPVCIAASDLTITNGSIGSVMGGNYFTTEAKPESAGMFARIKITNPNADPGDATRGIRCVGAPGVESKLQAQ
jgi:hypothetical protein